jgi:hypothetical protein
MSEQINHKAGGTTPASAQAASQPSVAELTTLLQEVNKLFPLPKRPAKLSTREGRAYKAAVAQREAYIAALQAAISNGRAADRFREELNLSTESQQRDAASYQEQINHLLRYIDQTGPFMLIAFQLGLLIQHRPLLAKTRQSHGDGHMVDFNIDRLRVSVFGDQQTVQVTAPGMQSRSFTFDDEGNILDQDVERLVGYLTMAGYTIKPEHIKQALSKDARSKLYASLGNRGRTIAALGHIALMGAAVSGLDEATLLRNKPRPSDILFGGESYDMPYGGDLLG